MAGKDLIVDLDSLDMNHVIADIEEIRKHNPQRFEMEQLTAIVYEDVEKFICVGYKDLTHEEFWVRGHMPGMPLMPGVVMLEAQLHPDERCPCVDAGRMTTKRKVRAAEWAERVRAWQRSGLTAAEYGARQGIDGKQLQWWKWRLGAGAKKSGAKGSGERELRFVPARVVERARGETSRVEIVLTNGRVVRVTGRVEPETLAQVLRVAGAGGA